MQGGMAGSHLRWSVYEDMVNKVWPQCSEQERRNLWLIMRRDLGSYWRPDEWSGFDLANAHGEGEWKPAAGVLTYKDDKRYDTRKVITDLTPWMYFRQVLARFDPDNQWAVTLRTPDSDTLESMLRLTPKASIISTPTPSKLRKYPMPLRPLIVRAYRWQDECRISWSQRIAPDSIVKAEKLEIPDTGEM
jgi:hypothetical protein